MAEASCGAGTCRSEEDACLDLRQALWPICITVGGKASQNIVKACLRGEFAARLISAFYRQHSGAMKVVV